MSVENYLKTVEAKRREQDERGDCPRVKALHGLGYYGASLWSGAFDPDGGRISFAAVNAYHKSKRRAQ